MKEHKMLMERNKKDSDELYRKDIVYKSLVDNYINSNDSNRAECINALATYTNRLQDNARYEFVKSLNITEEDLCEMFKKQVISNDMMLKIIKFKGFIKE